MQRIRAVRDTTSGLSLSSPMTLFPRSAESRATEKEIISVMRIQYRPRSQCGVLVPLADEVPYADAAALPHGHGEYVGKGHDVHGVGTCGESLIAEHVDEIGDHHLRKAVGKLFAPGRQADGQHLAEHPEREGPEKGGGKRQFLRNRMKSSRHMATPRLNDVEMAAPSTPRAGKPKCPKMSV